MTEIERLRAALAEETACARQTDHALAKAEAEIEQLQEALKECAEELAEYVEYRYKNTLDYPSQKRRYDRDMHSVFEARRLLEQKQHD